MAHGMDGKARKKVMDSGQVFFCLVGPSLQLHLEIDCFEPFAPRRKTRETDFNLVWGGLPLMRAWPGSRFLDWNFFTD